MSTQELADDPTTRTEQKAREIVVGIKEGASAAGALRWAMKQSSETGRPLRVVHAWQLDFHAVASAAPSSPLWEAATADARARATRYVLAAIDGTTAFVHWTLDIMQGQPGPCLAARSSGAHMLVLGTDKPLGTGLERADPGAVSRYCLLHVDTPVVAVSLGSCDGDVTTAYGFTDAEVAAR